MKGIWCGVLPKGSVESHEIYPQTALREAKEDAGIQLILSNTLEKFNIFSDTGIYRE